MSSKAKEQKIEIKIEPLKVNTIKVPIVAAGNKTLIMDRFPETVKDQILAKQTGISKSNKKQVRDTKQEILDAIHVTNKGKIGYPVHAFKQGMMECTSFVGDKMFSKKLVSGAVKIVNAEDGLIPIKFKKQDVLKHNIGHNVKFSPVFHEWSCELEIQFDPNNISNQDIITLLNYAGFYQGVGAWRPKCRDGGSGEYGMYEVKINKS